MHKRAVLILLVFLSAVFVHAQEFSDLDRLWGQVLNYRNPQTAADSMAALGKLGKGSPETVRRINNYLVETNLMFRSGINIDYSMVSACISALMELNDSSSYSVLFDVMCAGYPQIIVSEAAGALDIIDGDLRQFLCSIIERNPPEEKLIAFKASVNSERLSASERGQIAELALETAFASNEENVDLSAMRNAAIAVLTPLRWTRANALAVRHYYLVLADYQRGILPKARLIEAIACLGAVGNSDAALALGLQLGLINARTESTKTFDAEITLAIVQALGLIGDNAVFDHLFYASNLPYPENIRNAARESIDRLKW